jgi:hypothetical protein
MGRFASRSFGSVLPTTDRVVHGPSGCDHAQRHRPEREVSPRNPARCHGTFSWWPQTAPGVRRRNSRFCLGPLRVRGGVPHVKLVTTRLGAPAAYIRDQSPFPQRRRLPQNSLQWFHRASCWPKEMMVQVTGRYPIIEGIMEDVDPVFDELLQTALT